MIDEWLNKVLQGDNLELLDQLPDVCVDLVYIDPPFHSGRDYGEFSDKYDSLAAYIDFMKPRCEQLRRVLKPTGSFYYHCDPTASHHVKVMLDGVFGMANFRSEVIWKRNYAHNGARRYGPVHDTILFYSNSDEYTWNKIYSNLSSDYACGSYRRTETGTGRRYRLQHLMGPGVGKGQSGAMWRGVDPTALGQHWAIPGYARSLVQVEGTLAALDALDREGLVIWPRRAGGQPSIKRYLDQSKGIPQQDIITEVKKLGSRDSERTGYPTQKPTGLLKILIESSSKEGEVVLDAFCGSGTTLVAAAQSGRKWIGMDRSEDAIRIARKRIKKVQTKQMTFF